MDKFLDIKMATVIEEDFENEQHNLRARSFFFEDAPDEGTEDARDSDSENERNDNRSSNSEDSEHRSSFIEKDGPENSNLNSDIINSIVCPTHKFSLPPITIPDPSVGNISPSSSSSSSPALRKASRLPRATSPSAKGNTSLRHAFHFPSPSSGVHAASQERTLNKKMAFTLSTKDKFVTEMSFFHPFSFLKSKMINLGVFLATSRAFGDHFIYKISPLSPFNCLNLQPQDRITKINNFDITNWPHNTVINFIRHVTQIDQNRFNSTGNIFTFKFSLEFLPVNRPLSSPDQIAWRNSAHLDVTMQPNGRVSVSSNRIQPVRAVSYRNATACNLLKVFGSDEQYVKVEEEQQEGGGEGGASGRGQTPLRVAVGEKEYEETGANIIFHKFETVPVQSGDVVALETFRPGTFFHVGTNESGSFLSLISPVNGTRSPSDLQSVQSADSRLFRMYCDEGDDRWKIYNIQSELYLKAEYPSVTLVEAPETFTDSMLFYTYPCTN